MVEEHETSLPTTSENPLEAEENTDHDENVLIDEQLTSEDPPVAGEIDNLCRADEQVRCGSTSSYICDVQKCDGNKDCPNGEDEEDCLTGGSSIDSSNDSDGSGDEEPLEPERILPPLIENEIEAPAGDFFIFIIFKILTFSNQFSVFFVDNLEDLNFLYLNLSY